MMTPALRRASDDSRFNVSLTSSLRKACTIFGLKEARMRLQTVYFQSDYTSLSMLCAFLMKSVLHASAKKADKKA